MTPACAAVAAAARHDALMSDAMPKFIAAESTPIHDHLAGKFWPASKPARRRNAKGQYLPKEQSR